MCVKRLNSKTIIATMFLLAKKRKRERKKYITTNKIMNGEMDI